MASNSKKRRTAPVILEENPGKRIKLAPANTQAVHIPQLAQDQNTVTNSSPVTKKDQKRPRPEPTESVKRQPKIKKLEPPRPFPAVAPSSSATGPRSAQKEGKNYICLSRKTSLGAYMRKCKNLVLNEGYKILHLHAMGAAIPLLVQLSCALPPILPFSEDEIHTEITTGTVSVQDEVLPDNEDEDVTYSTREKSTLYVVIRIGDGESGPSTRPGKTRSSGNKPKPLKPLSESRRGDQQILIYEEPEQVQEDI